MEGEDFNIFAEAQLPLTEKDLAKPSKDFVVNIISVFFNKFHINGYRIKQVFEI